MATFPEGIHSDNPYLNFSGNTEEAFKFYKSVFGGEFTAIQRFSEWIPSGKETPAANMVQANEKDKIMHVALPIGKGNVLMGTDALESMGHKVTFGNNFHISIEAESKDEATKIFNKLSPGGKIVQPLKDEFWGAYYGQLTDKFGISWMVNYTYPKQK